MEVHRQRCQACQSIKMTNILVREPGQSQVVLVRCAQCGELVARYDTENYYHHGKGFESWLASYSGDHESGRDLLKSFNSIRDQTLVLFNQVLRLLKALGKD